MTKRISGDEVNTQKHIRFFVQPGGPGPENPVFYSGASNAYINIESATNPVRGGVSPINVHDPQGIGRYRQVGNQVDAPDFATATVQFLQKRDFLPRHLTDLLDCYSNFYQVAGSCKDPSDFLGGWSSYVKAFSYGQATQPTEAGGSFDSDERLMDEVEFTFIGGIYNMGKLGFSEKGATEVYSQVKGITYGNRVQCGACGPSDNGSKLIYAVTDNTVASPGQAPALYYSIDGGVSFTEQAITGIASGDTPTDIAIIGNNVVVSFDDSAAGGYFYAEINNITGVPGTWTKVTTGFVSGAAPTRMYVASASEFFFSGNNGHIYKSTSLAGGVSVSYDLATGINLLDINGLDETIVAVGDTDSIYKSSDGGNSWEVIVNALNNITHCTNVQVINDVLYWFGGDDGSGGIGDTGYVDYTLDGGQSTSTYQLGTFAGVDDMLFVSPEFGYITTYSSSPAGTVWSTWNGGNTWTQTSPRILNTPTADRYSRIAAPISPNNSVMINNLAIGGLAGNASDGIILVASATTR